MADYNQLSMTHHRAQREPACHTTLQASCMVLGFDQVTQCWFAMHVSRSLAVLYDTCFVPSTVLLCPLLLQIMKSDEDVRMISAEAPVLFAKACEMFILEMTLRSWAHADEGKRRTLQRSDVAAAISRNEIFDFLADVVPVDEAAKEGEQAAAPSPVAQPAAAAAAPGMYAYNYTAADQAAAAGVALDPAMLAYQQQTGLVPGQQWAAAGLPDGGHQQ
eukprot:GHRQ01019363.1.p1 GENE.GHRQ01019363.1~~GHRQ01019363.1.p1  ORF type:complete len:218 (+),score=90.21 GHRQ01019363.1:772-1425(+)